MKKQVVFLAAGLALSTALFGSLSGCSGSKPENEENVQAGDAGFKAEDILHEREEKDKEFRTEYSPLPPDKLEQFTGLHYYEASSQYNVPAQLEVFTTPDTVKIAATKSDDIRTMVRYGVFTFTIDGTPCKLTAYQNTGVSGAHHPNLLFVPFRDKTTGGETYDAGRYMDIAILPGKTAYRLDFNRAYNPYCAYNDAYSCPLVPEENTLPVAIEAGEKVYGH